MTLLSASLLSCDLLNLESEIKSLEQAGVDYLHIDVMDGHFVPNIAFGIDIIRRISDVSSLPINVHLMIEKPDQFIDVVAYSNVNFLIVHLEGNRNLERTISKIKNRGIGVGIALNPMTSASMVQRFVPMIDLVTVMGVHPGFGGQTLIPSTIDKIRTIKNMPEARNKIVAIDGGVNNHTALLANDAKADILIVGSYLFDNNGPDKVSSMKEKIKSLCGKE